MTIRPMKPAGPSQGFEGLHQVRFPVLCTPKYDGIRAIVMKSVVYSAKMKPLPSQWVQERYGTSVYEGLDGELVVGDPVDPMCFRKTCSAVMSHDGRGADFHTFDRWNKPDEPYTVRSRGTSAPITTIRDLTELQEYEHSLYMAGWEGIILRSMDGLYKYGRSTLRQHWLLKYKRFQDAEAVVIGFKERLHNANEATINELGKTKRSSHKENMVPTGTMGALVCEFTSDTGEISEISVGIPERKDQIEFWAMRLQLLGKTVKFKFQRAPGQPRFGTFLGLRDERD